MSKEELTVEDVLNVTGSMFSTMLDYAENSNNELEQLQQENKQLKDNWEIIRQYCLDEQIPEESDEYNSYIEFSNSVYDNILNKMQELQGSGNNE